MEHKAHDIMEITLLLPFNFKHTKFFYTLISLSTMKQMARSGVEEDGEELSTGADPGFSKGGGAKFTQ